MRTPRNRTDARAAAELSSQLAALTTMTASELAERYEAVYGEPPRSRHKDHLRKKVAWRIQELAEGGLSKRALARIEELAPGAPVRWRTPRSTATAAPPASQRDPRLPEPGTTIARAYRGTDHTVTVLADGFEYEGVRYGSLSKIARAITGTNWNGFLFFQLDNRAGKGTSTTAEART